MSTSTNDHLDMPDDRHTPAPLPHPAPQEQSVTRSPLPLPTSSTSRAPLEPMPRRTIAIVAASIGAATIGLVVALWWAGTAGLSGAALVSARFDALRTGLSIGVGGGGIFALYLAWRRQHATEIGLVQKERDQADVARAYELQREIAEHTRQHSERVAVTTERDAEARRITDLYAKSVEQLGSDKAPVRHGGLYALERLAQDHPDNPALRQTVVNVVCAYLRTPFDIPEEKIGPDILGAIRAEHRERVQEREVRLTAQQILTTHLKPVEDTNSPASTFWPNIDLDLTSATLINCDMSKTKLRDAIFKAAVFTGDTQFHGAKFAGKSSFDHASFEGEVDFSKSTFVEPAQFSGAIFTERTLFNNVTFTERTNFTHARFSAITSFSDTSFSELARFANSSFTEQAWFNNAKFAGWAVFHQVSFTGGVRFEHASFTKSAQFNSSTFAKHAWFNNATFQADAFFTDAKFDEDSPFGEMGLSVATEHGSTLRYIFGEPTFIERNLPSEVPTENENASDQVPLTEGVRFDAAKFSQAPFFDSAILRHNPARYSINFSSWPNGWRPAQDHITIEGHEGTWHQILGDAAKRGSGD